MGWEGRQEFLQPAEELLVFDRFQERKSQLFLTLCLLVCQPYTSVAQLPNSSLAAQIGIKEVEGGGGGR